MSRWGSSALAESTRSAINSEAHSRIREARRLSIDFFRRTAALEHSIGSSCLPQNLDKNDSTKVGDRWTVATIALSRAISPTSIHPMGFYRCGRSSLSRRGGSRSSGHTLDLRLLKQGL